MCEFELNREKKTKEIKTNLVRVFCQDRFSTRDESISGVPAVTFDDVLKRKNFSLQKNWF